MLEKNKKSISIILVLILVVCLFPPTRICSTMCANYHPRFIYNVVYGPIVPLATYIAWDILLLQIFIIAIITSILLLFKHK